MLKKKTLTSCYFYFMLFLIKAMDKIRKEKKKGERQLEFIWVQSIGGGMEREGCRSIAVVLTGLCFSSWFKWRTYSPLGKMSWEFYYLLTQQLSMTYNKVLNYVQVRCSNPALFWTRERTDMFPPQGKIQREKKKNSSFHLQQ